MSQLAGARDRARPTLERYRGFTLVEIMVSLAIGSILMLGAVQILMHGRAAYRVAQSVAELQERARFAIAVLDDDVRNAGFWGLSSITRNLRGRAAAPGSPPIAVGNDCGTDWTIELDMPVAGHDEQYGLACKAYRGSSMPGADTLIIRRAASETTERIEAGRLYITTTRAGGGILHVGGPVPAEFPAADRETRELLVHAYYVSPTSSLSTPGNQVPSLRMKTLVGGRLGPRIVDEEVFPGVEDMQIELGVDSDRQGQAGHGTVDRYLEPGLPELDRRNAAYDPNLRILAVRVWLRLRAERRENGYVDTARFEYAGHSYVPRADAYRRELATTTIAVRNAILGR